MATQLASFPAATFDWRRVGAFSTSLAAHLVAFALVLIPLAPPLERSLQRAIEVTFLEAPPPPPKFPPPPEPEPLRKPPPRATPAPLPPKPPAPVAVTEAPSPVTIPAAIVPTAPTAVDIAPATEPSAPAGETRRLAYDGDLRLRYPAVSVRAREQGTVVLRVLVDADGRVERVEIERSSGYAKLDAAGRDAVLRGRFKPVLIDGKPTPAWGLVPIEFRLDRA
ncbi:energy transducer TonB [Dokdonella sp.]|uniref:energy transducer TonB n=1 Tax=Dokdonella sp. TaxID=2291710 RepID=UPI001B2509C0|nr:energy transducer TonB [Dokdonella sp.]MBO9664260.1 TonB family protein [Dokdonella sp.]